MDQAYLGKVVSPPGTAIGAGYTTTVDYTGAGSYVASGASASASSMSVAS